MGVARLVIDPAPSAVDGVNADLQPVAVKMQSRRRRQWNGAWVRERRPAPLGGAQRERVHPPAKKRGDGLERRPPAGIARERETSAHDTAPCQSACRTPPSTGCRDRSPLPGAAPFSCRAGCAGGPDHVGFSRWGPAQRSAGPRKERRPRPGRRPHPFARSFAAMNAGCSTWRSVATFRMTCSSSPASHPSAKATRNSSSMIVALCSLATLRSTRCVNS